MSGRGRVMVYGSALAGLLARLPGRPEPTSRSLRRFARLERAYHLAAGPFHRPSSRPGVRTVEEILSRAVEGEDQCDLDGDPVGGHCAPELEGGQPSDGDLLWTGLHHASDLPETAAGRFAGRGGEPGETGSGDRSRQPVGADAYPVFGVEGE